MSEPITPKSALEALRVVLDPEVGLNIVDLGLVRDIQIDSSAIRVTMTMTTPACPMSQSIAADVESTLEPLADGRAVSVDLTFQPPWTPDDMSEDARRFLGLG